MASLEEVKKFLKKSVDWLKDEDMGCTTLKLDDKLAICVGWLPGYGEEKRDDVIQSTSEPDFAINAGLKVWTSDDMRTDYEFINMPYYENGEVVETDVSIDPSDEEDGYEQIAKWLLDSYDGIKDLNIDDKGLIHEEELTERSMDLHGLYSKSRPASKPEEEKSTEEPKEESLKEEKEDDKLNSYKEEFVKTLDEFSKVYKKLVELMSNANFDVNEFINTKKAREHMDNSFAKKSLDELDISEWCEEVKSNIGKWKPGEWLDESLKESNTTCILYQIQDEKGEDLGTFDNEEDAYKEKTAIELSRGIKGKLKVVELEEDCKLEEKMYSKRDGLITIVPQNIYEYKGFILGATDGGYTIRENDHKTNYKEIGSAKSLEAACDFVDSYLKESKEEKKEIKESWDGDSIIDDLIERAQSKIDDGQDADDAVMEAIDEGLIYTSDIITLLDHYGSIDDSTIIESYYDDLYSDVLNGVEIPEEDVDFNWEEDEEKVEESLEEAKGSNGERIAKLFAKALKGKCGPFGGENPYLNGNELTLTSQGPNETWIFNDDGSVDMAEDEEEFISHADLDDYGCEDEEELRDYYKEISHFDTIKDLLHSGLSWFSYLDDKSILKKVDEILG